MQQAATLAQTAHYRMQRFYRCASCRNVEMIEVP
jgi:hypothetical protein